MAINKDTGVNEWDDFEYDFDMLSDEAKRAIVNPHAMLLLIAHYKDSDLYKEVPVGVNECFDAERRILVDRIRETLQELYKQQLEERAIPGAENSYRILKAKLEGGVIPQHLRSSVAATIDYVVSRDATFSALTHKLQAENARFKTICKRIVIAYNAVRNSSRENMSVLGHAQELDEAIQDLKPVLPDLKAKEWR